MRRRETGAVAERTIGFSSFEYFEGKGWEGVNWIAIIKDHRAGKRQRNVY